VTVAACAFFAAYPDAHANGRQPNTTGIAVDANNPNRLLAGVTFGAVVSDDGGLNWHWVCEEVLGGPSAVDAQVLIANTGTLLVANPNGIYASSDDGCTWSQMGNIAPPLQTSWLSLHPTDANQWLVTVNDPNQNGGLVYQSSNAGQSFAALPQPMARVYLYSVAYAASAPNRIYAGGSNNGSVNSAYVFVSNDGGQSWQSHVVANAPPASAQTRVAVSPIDPNIVLVAAQNVSTSGTSILRSTDGAQTFEVVTTMTSALRNMVFSTDGTQVFAASQARIAHSTDAGASFTILASPMYNACVTLADDTVYGCGNEASGDAFTIGRSTDEGATWQTVVDLTQIQGPFGCGSTTNTYATCMPMWADEAGSIGAAVQPVTRLPSATGTDGSTVGAAKSAEGGCHCQSVRATGPIWLAIAAFGLRRRYARRHFSR
jgi:hypothetical protein